MGFLPLVLSSIGLGIIRVDVPIEFIVVAATAPTLGALCSQRLVDRNFRICRFYSSWQRLLLGSVAGFALMMIASVVLPRIVLAKVSPQALHWSAVQTPTAYEVNWVHVSGWAS